MTPIFVALIVALPAAISPVLVALITTRKTNGKLDVIETLVNSQLTSAIQSELDGTIRELATMRELIALKEVGGHDPTPSTLAAVKTTEAKIADLQDTLVERSKQQQLADKQAA